MARDWNIVSSKTHSLIPNLFEPEVRSYLATTEDRRQILLWLDDSSRLIKEAHKSNWGFEFYDYSFMVMPAFKALEKWLLDIAPKLGVDAAKVKAAEEYAKFGAFLNDNAIDDLVQEVVARLSLNADKEKELRHSMRALESYLKNLRHNPAHCSSVVENPHKAETMFREVVGAIDRITAQLIADGILI